MKKLIIFGIFGICLYSCGNAGPSGLASHPLPAVMPTPGIQTEDFIAIMKDSAVGSALADGTLVTEIRTSKAEFVQEIKYTIALKTIDFRLSGPDDDVNRCTVFVDASLSRMSDDAVITVEPLETLCTVIESLRDALPTIKGRGMPLSTLLGILSSAKVSSIVSGKELIDIVAKNQFDSKSNLIFLDLGITYGEVEGIPSSQSVPCFLKVKAETDASINSLLPTVLSANELCGAGPLF